MNEVDLALYIDEQTDGVEAIYVAYFEMYRFTVAAETFPVQYKPLEFYRHNGALPWFLFNLAQLGGSPDDYVLMAIFCPEVLHRREDEEIRSIVNRVKQRWLIEESLMNIDNTYPQPGTLIESMLDGT